jgi:polar amino acid transport system permease protein
MNYDWDFSAVITYPNMQLIGFGLLVTIAISFLSVIWGTVLGLGAGIAASLGRVQGMENESGGIQVIRLISIISIDFIRSIPLLLLLLVVYYGLPVLCRGFGYNPSTFVLCTIAMSFNFAAFLADLFRGSSMGPLRESVLAARALGMNGWQIYRRILLPEIVRDVLPGYGLLVITIFKMSTLCSIVAVYELLHSAETLIQKTYRPLELYILVMAIFVAIIWPFAILIRRMEQLQALRRRD